MLSGVCIYILCACVCIYVYVCLSVSVCEHLFTCIFICLCIDENQLRTKRKQDFKCISTRTWFYQLKGMAWVSALEKHRFDGTTHDYKYLGKYLLYLLMKNTPDKRSFPSTMNAKLLVRWTFGKKKPNNLLLTFAATTLRISEHFRRFRSRKYCLSEHRIRKHSG